MNCPSASIDCGGGVVLQRGQRMRTRDGVTLVSDHYLPPGGAPAPTLLMRQPYGRDIASTVVYAHPVWFAQRGYHVVIQDVRGRGDSEGDFYPFRFEAEDGYDAVQWVAGLPESNGRVGMYGFSYQGLTQLLAAAEQPPALCAIAPAMTAGDLYAGWFYHGGMLGLASTMAWATQMLRGDAWRLGRTEAAERLEKAWTQLGPIVATAPYARPDHLRDPGLPSYYHDWIEHDTPGDYWARLDISTRYEKICVPALHLAGWHDVYLRGSLQGFQQLQARAGTAGARAGQYLVVGPWLHIPWTRQVGEIDFGPAAELATDELLVRWFDHWLKGEGTWSDEPRARIFTLGSNRWQEYETWPAATTGTDFYLHSHGRANSSHGDGRLAGAVPASSQPRDILVVDPEVPVGAPGGAGAAAGPYRQNRISAGNNVLVYRSEPLERAIQVCGAPRLKLWLACSRDACDVVAKLTRTDRQNATWNISLGAVRSQRWFGPLEPDRMMAWEIALDETSCVIEAGERLGLEIAGHAFPQLDRSAHRAEIAARDASPANWRRATLQIAHEEGMPSALTLPLWN